MARVNSNPVFRMKVGERDFGRVSEVELAREAHRSGSAMIWCCPRCHGDLTQDLGEKLQCNDCHSEYGSVDGIPDLRVPGDSWIDFEEDLESARKLAAMNCSLTELVREVYAIRPGWDEARIDKRTKEVLAAPAKLSVDISTWLRPLASRGVLLDLGCGAGMLTAALVSEGRPAVGVDVSMTWLVVAKRLISHFGGVPLLAAALGESLPLREESVDGVISLDVIEHVHDPDAYLREIDRVTKKGCRIALSTPNRFSITPEPHVFVWGVGWLPRKWQARYVRWRSGRAYDDTRLMSSFGLRSRLRRNTTFRFDILIPQIPDSELAKFKPTKAAAARLYNWLASVPPMRLLFLIVGPFFRVIGVKTKSEGAVP
jgi:2-polyprenyl-3-methyl-5-hydroxy-6-metoxy-1,4-benzoquinol methylase